MKKISKILAVIAASLMLFSCASGPKKSEAYSALYGENPLVMLVMPPINQTSNAEAKDLFYTTINVPIAEAGYYILPPAACYATMQRESAYDSERFIDGDLKKFNKLFGADVAIFTVIKSWDKNVITSDITIEIEYILKSTKTNEVLFDRDTKIVCDTSSNVTTSGGGLLGALINVTANVVKTVVTDYVSIAVQGNNQAFIDLPKGKYSPNYTLDGEEASYPKYYVINTSK